MDRNILDAVSGGALVDKTPVAAKALIENKSLNSQQFTTRDNSVQSKGVSQIQVSSNKALDTRIDELTALVKQLAVAKPQTATLCGICTSPEHPTDTCSILRDESITELPQAYAANLYNQNSQQHNSPQVAALAPSGPSLEDLVKQMAVNNLQLQQRTDASIQTLNTQMGQLATQINNMQAQGSNQLPAQTVVNPNGPNANVSAISLRSGKVIEPAPEKNKKIIEVPKYAKFLKDLCTSKKRLKGNERVYLGRNISALIQPKHSPEKATVSSLNQAIPQKCKDPGTFYIPCTIGDSEFDNCMLDLGADINVIPTSVYNNLDLGPLQHTGTLWAFSQLLLHCCALVLATRSSCSELFDFDHEVERTLHTRRRAGQTSNSSPPTIESDSDSDYFHNLFDSDSEIVFDMADQRALRQLVAPDVNYNGLC
ncbi:uncharacterized protein LOC127080255 [Lathyrus oleraceus]|uniref:uncharacterized protein LOC127080255 n=1 Tax=Pisum sativum TaxID=3888 RepID=UPI0021D38B2D|nr:uncharacterized protein LOC127080255 [Pisum sativum]